MKWSLTGRTSGRPLRVTTVLGLLLVPLTAAGVLLFGLWNPTDRLQDVTAAVVNLDEPVTVDGQLTPLGRVLAGELIGATDTNFTWVLTDSSDARAGLDDGRYASVVTIPASFSSDATSLARGATAAKEATIDVATSDRGRLLDSALSNIVTTTAVSMLNRELGERFVGNILIGMTKLGAGVGEAADGAHQLASGTSELATGAQQLADGGTQLAAGGSQLAAGAQQAAAGGSQLADGVAAYTGQINQVLGGLQAQGPEFTAQMANLRALIADGTIPLPPGSDLTQVLAQFDAMLASLGGVGAQLNQVIAGGNELAAAARASANGQSQLAAGLDSYASGVAGFSAGVTKLSAGVPSLAGGMEKLAGGLDEISAAVPQNTDEENQRMAAVAVHPVAAEGGSDALFNASGVPLFVGLALWAGAFASFLVLAPLWRRTREAARGLTFVTLRSALPAAALGAAQGAVVGAILPFLLGYSFGQGLAFFGLALVAGVSFALVNQGLSALFRGVGRFLSFVLLTLGFAIGVISTAPPLLTAVGDASPLGTLFSGFQAIAMGVSGGWGAALLLGLWGVVGLVMTGLAAGRARRQVSASL